jgi:hypothetical protein
MLLIFLVFGPEFGIGLEMVVLMDFLGVELFLFALLVGLRLPYFTHLVHSASMKVDPYYFIPTRAQMVSCPGMLAHTVPGPASFYFLLAFGGVIAAL